MHCCQQCKPSALERRFGSTVYNVKGTLCGERIAFHAISLEVPMCLEMARVVRTFHLVVDKWRANTFTVVHLIFRTGRTSYSIHIRCT